MREYLKFYIDGTWVDPVRPNTLEVDNPTTEQVSGVIAIGSAADVDVAVQAARRAFASWSQTTREERLGWSELLVHDSTERKRAARYHCGYVRSDCQVDVTRGDRDLMRCAVRWCHSRRPRWC